MSVSPQTVIRLATPSDAPAVAAIYAPIVRETHISAEFEPPGAEEMRRRIADTLATHPWLVAERGREIVGYAYATRFRSRPAYQWTAEVSVYIRSDSHRCGLGPVLYSSLFECLRLQGFQQAIAVIALPNPPSVALHERLGFVPVGVFPSVCFKRLPRESDVPQKSGRRPEAGGQAAQAAGGSVVDAGVEGEVWYDIGWWRLTLADRTCAPPTLRTPAELAGTAKWFAAHAADRRTGRNS